MRLTLTPGRWTLATIACLTLAVMLPLVFGPGKLGLFLGLAALAGAVRSAYAGVRARRAERYDLHRLVDEPPWDPEETPVEDTLPPGVEAAVYCAWCDEAFNAVEPRCPRCGRPF